MLALARGGRVSGEITNWMSVAQGEPRRARRGIAAAKAARQARRGPQRRRVLQPPQRALAPPGSPPTTRRSRARRRCTRLRLGHVDDAAPVLAAPGPRADAARAAAGRRPARRRLMFTTDGAVPRFYAERGVIGGCAADRHRASASTRCARCRWRRSTRRRSSASTRSSAAIAPGRRATLQRPARDRRVAAGARARRRRGRRPRRRARRRAARASTGRAGPPLVAPAPRPFAPLTGVQPVARYESAVINRRVDREVTPRRPAGGARRPRRHLGHQGRDRELPRRRRRASPPPRRPRSSCSSSARTRRAMARAAARVAEHGRRVRVRRRLVGAAGDRRPDHRRRLRRRALRSSAS